MMRLLLSLRMSRWLMTACYSHTLRSSSRERSPGSTGGEQSKVLQRLRPLIMPKMLLDCQCHQLINCTEFEVSDAPAAVGCMPILFHHANTSQKKQQSDGGTNTNGQRAKISTPKNVKCIQHVRYNPDLVRYEGIDASSLSVNQQFGVPFSTVPKIVVDGYTHRIPAILVWLWKNVLKSEGEKAVGIFRLAADKVVMEVLKRQLNTGQYTGEIIEENVAATMIKIWFRELPTNILNIVDKSLLDRVAGRGTAAFGDSPSEEKRLAGASNVMAAVEEGFRVNHAEQEFEVFLWLLDVMAHVVAHKAENKMSFKNMAIVVAPNLSH